MAKKIRWGIMGCGGIAGSFARDLALTKHGQLAAVGSRSKVKAKKFAAPYEGVRAHGSYEELVQDKNVDIVYVATPHPWHMDNTLLAIRAGKHVLCEKPIAMNARQTQRMITAAREKGVFLMEGMWARFFPAMVQLRKWLAAGRIGKVSAVEADFGVCFRFGEKHRVFNPDLGGGVLLDLGIYPISFASMVYGVQPEKIVSTVHKTQMGVDDHAVIGFEYTDSTTAALGISGIVKMKNEARIFGTKGIITVHESFYRPNRLTLEMEGKKPKIIDFSYSGGGMQFEADHVNQCLRNGKLQSNIMPLDETRAIMQTMDKIRRQWKLKYPNE